MKFGSASVLRMVWIPVLIGVSELPAQAGMTVYGLGDIYRLRLEEISFLLFLLLGCAFFIKLLWNYAFKGFASIPRIKFLQAVAVSILFGLVMLLILTMISGIREVLTPGAWRHQGTSYKLNASAQEPVRRRSLEHLRVSLMSYAQAHDGKFPPTDFGGEISDKIWESPDEAGSHYIYRGGLTTLETNAVLAVEPAMFGEKRLVLFVSGKIEMLANPEIERKFYNISNP